MTEKFNMRNILKGIILFILLICTYSCNAVSCYSTPFFTADFTDRHFVYSGTYLNTVTLSYTGDPEDGSAYNELCYGNQNEQNCERNQNIKISLSESDIPVAYCGMSYSTGQGDKYDGNISVGNTSMGKYEFTVSVNSPLASPTDLQLHINYTARPVFYDVWIQDDESKTAIVEVVANYNNNGHAGNFQVNNTSQNYLTSNYYNKTYIPFMDINVNADFLFESGSTSINYACNDSPDCRNRSNWSPHIAIKEGSGSTTKVGHSIYEGIVNGKLDGHLFADGQIWLEAKQPNSTIKKYGPWKLNIYGGLDGDPISKVLVYDPENPGYKAMIKATPNQYDGSMTITNDQEHYRVDVANYRNYSGIPFTGDSALYFTSINDSGVCVTDWLYTLCPSGSGAVNKLPIEGGSAKAIAITYTQVYGSPITGLTIGNIVYKDPQTGKQLVNFAVTARAGAEPLLKGSPTSVTTSAGEATFVPNYPANLEITICPGKQTKC